MKYIILFLLFINAAKAQNIYIKTDFPVGHAVLRVNDTIYSFGNYNRHGIFRIFPKQGVLYKYNINKFDTTRFKSFSIRSCNNIINVKRYKLFKYNCIGFINDVTGNHIPSIPLIAKRKLEDKWIPTKNEIILCVFQGISGSIWGMREAFHADSSVFENKFGAKEYSFFGSKQWERKYVGGKYNGPDTPIKTQIFGNFGVDFWHTSKYTVFTLSTTCTFFTGNSKQKLKYKLIDMLIQSIIFSASSNITYKLMRS